MAIKVFIVLALTVVAALGKSSHRAETSRIIGGTEAQKHAYPWQVSLQMKVFLNVYSHFCGGSIIDETTILTAAHCVQDFSPKRVKVLAGAHSLSGDAEDSWQRVGVESMTPHENFDLSVAYNDVGIIKLKEPLKFNEFVAPIKLPDAGFDPSVGTKCLNSGWGKDHNGIFAGLPDKLQVVELPIYERAECKQVYDGISPVMEGEVCAGTHGSGVSACSGDSGGPLFCPSNPEDANSDPVLVGVVSWGVMPCGSHNKPGVYANVGFYRDWIESNRK